MTLHKPDKGEVSTAVATAMAASVPVVIAIIIGAAMIVNWHAELSVVAGWFE
jgi:hypothetical protein